MTARQVDDDAYVKLFDLATNQIILNCARPRAEEPPLEGEDEFFTNATRLYVVSPYKEFGDDTASFLYDDAPQDMNEVRKVAKAFVQISCLMLHNLEEGKDVLPYCKNGRTRSPSAIAAFFLLFRGYKPEELKTWFREAFRIQRPKTVAKSGDPDRFPNFARFQPVLDFLVRAFKDETSVEYQFVQDEVQICEKHLQKELLPKLFPTLEVDKYSVDGMPNYCNQLPRNAFPPWAGKLLVEWTRKHQGVPTSPRLITRTQKRSTISSLACRSPEGSGLRQVKTERVLPERPQEETASQIEPGCAVETGVVAANNVANGPEVDIAAQVTTTNGNQASPLAHIDSNVGSASEGETRGVTAPTGIHGATSNNKRQAVAPGARQSKRNRRTRELFQPGKENGKGMEQVPIEAYNAGDRAEHAAVCALWDSSLKPEPNNWKLFHPNSAVADDFGFIPATLAKYRPKLVQKLGTQGIHYAIGWAGLAEMVQKFGTTTTTPGEKFPTLVDFDTKHLDELVPALERAHEDYYTADPSTVDLFRVLEKTGCFKAHNNVDYKLITSTGSIVFTEAELLTFLVQNGIPNVECLDPEEREQLEEMVKFANVDRDDVHSAKSNLNGFSAKILNKEEVRPVLARFGFQRDDKDPDRFYQPEGKNAGKSSMSLKETRLFVRANKNWNANGRRPRNTGQEDKKVLFSLRLWGATAKARLPAYVERRQSREITSPALTATPSAQATNPRAIAAVQPRIDAPADSAVTLTSSASAPETPSASASITPGTGANERVVTPFTASQQAPADNENPESFEQKMKTVYEIYGSLTDDWQRETLVTYLSGLHKK